MTLTVRMVREVLDLVLVPPSSNSASEFVTILVWSLLPFLSFSAKFVQRKPEHAEFGLSSAPHLKIEFKSKLINKCWTSSFKLLTL